MSYDILETLANDRGEDFRDNYSGRGMRNQTCCGIVTDSPMDLIEDAAERGIRGALTDGMGRRTIVYWPKITKPTQATR